MIYLLSGLARVDFANVARQLRFFTGKEDAPETTPLKAELEVRRDSLRRLIGFIHETPQIS
jgi:hypothetical protein